jgi:type IV secretion system protein VirD4
MDFHGENLFVGLLVLGGLWVVMRGILGAIACRGVLLAAWGIAACGVAVIAMKFPAVGWIGLGLIAWGMRRGWRGAQYAHGTARVADLQDLGASGLLGTNDGLILGRAGYTARPSRWQAIRMLLLAPLRRSALAVRLYFAAFGGPRWGRDSMIRLNQYVHLATFAPTGRGKGVSVLVPNLLSHRGSCVVTDPKGELFKLTAAHRRRKFKHRIIRLDPFGLGGPGADTFNPLDLIDANAPDFLDQCRDLANALVVRTGQEHEPHWNDSAELILTSFIAFVAACETSPEHRHLQTVRDLVSSRDKFTKSVAAMQQSDVLQRQGHLLNWYQEKELSSIMSTVQRHSAFLDSPAVAACTLRSSFDPRELRSGRMTAYLILPPERLVSLAPLMRMWVASILRTLARGTASERNPVLFLIDEAAHLGHIQALEDAVTLMRGYGIRLWFFFQSLGQLTKCFGDHAPVFLDNIDTQQYFGVNAYESAEAISKRMGDATITSESYNSTSGHSRSYGGKGQEGGNVSTGTSVTISEMGRRLLKPEEIMCLPEDLAVVFHRNLPPICARLLRYYDAPEFRRGRTGRQRGLGLAAGLTALMVLLVSGIFAAFAFSLPAPDAPPRAAVGPAGWDLGGWPDLNGGQWNMEPIERNPFP